jgi:hypothetical protein
MDPAKISHGRMAKQRRNAAEIEGFCEEKIYLIGFGG